MYVLTNLTSAEAVVTQSYEQEYDADVNGVHAKHFSVFEVRFRICKYFIVSFCTSALTYLLNTSLRIY